MDKLLKEQQNEVCVLLKNIDKILNNNFIIKLNSDPAIEQIISVLFDLKKAVDNINNRLYWAEMSIDRVEYPNEW